MARDAKQVKTDAEKEIAALKDQIRQIRQKGSFKGVYRMIRSETVAIAKSGLDEAGKKNAVKALLSRVTEYMK